MNWALVNKETNIVENIVVWDGSGDIFPDYTCVALQENEKCQIGQLYAEDDLPRFSGNPVLPKTYTAYEFLKKLTTQERANIRNLAQTDDIAADFLMFAEFAQEIRTDDVMTVQGLDYLVSVGVFSEERKNEILS
jgi:hypothetical protein